MPAGEGLHGAQSTVLPGPGWGLLHVTLAPRSASPSQGCRRLGGVLRDSQASGQLPDPGRVVQHLQQGRNGQQSSRWI